MDEASPKRFVGCLCQVLGRRAGAEEIERLGIFDLREVLIELADGPEAGRCEEANHLVTANAYLREPIGGGDGHGDDQLEWFSRAGHLERGDHR